MRSRCRGAKSEGAGAAHSQAEGLEDEGDLAAMYARRQASVSGAMENGFHGLWKAHRQVSNRMVPGDSRGCRWNAKASCRSFGTDVACYVVVRDQLSRYLRHEIEAGPRGAMFVLSDWNLPAPGELPFDPTALGLRCRWATGVAVSVTIELQAQMVRVQRLVPQHVAENRCGVSGSLIFWRPSSL